MSLDYNKMSPEDRHFAKMRADSVKYSDLPYAIKKATDKVIQLAEKSARESEHGSNQSVLETFGGTVASVAAFSQAVSKRFQHHADQLQDPSNLSGYQQLTKVGGYEFAFEVSGIEYQRTASKFAFTIKAEVEGKYAYPIPNEPEPKRPKGDSSFCLTWNGSIWNDTEVPKESNQSKSDGSYLHGLIETVKSGRKDAGSSKQ